MFKNYCLLSLSILLHFSNTSASNSLENYLSQDILAHSKTLEFNKKSTIQDSFFDFEILQDNGLNRVYSPLQPELIVEHGQIKQQAGFTFNRLPEIADVANFVYSWTGTNEEDLEFNQYAKDHGVKNFKVIKAIYDEKNGLNALALLKDDILYVAYRGTVTFINDLCRSDLAIGLNNFTSYVQQIIKKGGEFTPAFLNNLVGSLVDGALYANVTTAEDFLLGTISKVVESDLPYRKLIVTGHSLGGFYTQVIGAKFPGLVDEAHAFNGPGVPALYIPYDAPGHHIFNHIRADWTDIDPIGKFAVHHGNVIFYPTANREGIVAKINPIHQHLMGQFADALRAGLKPYPGAKLETFTTIVKDENDMLKSIINFEEIQKPMIQKHIEKRVTGVNALNPAAFEAFEDCSTMIKSITGHENYYFDMLSNDGVKSANYYKKDLMDIKEIMNNEYNSLMNNPSDQNVERFRRICKELTFNVAEKLHQANERKKTEASKSTWSKITGWFGF